MTTEAPRGRYICSLCKCAVERIWTGLPSGWQWRHVVWWPNWIGHTPVVGKDANDPVVEVRSGS